MAPRSQLLFAVPLIALGFLTCTLRAGDWPQILGPQRNGQAVGEQLSDRWAKDPTELWRSDLGEGYAGPAVVGSRVYVFHRVEDEEVLEALDLQSGKQLWQVTFPADYRGGIDPDTGPRCVPLVAMDRVVVFGAAGVARCVDGKGQIVWTRDLYQEFEAQEGYFGAGSSPILVGDNVLFNVGGTSTSGIVALSLETGEVIWKAGDEAASYSSPTAFLQAGQLRVAFVTRLNLLIADPSTGRVLIRQPFGKRGPTVNAATPLAVGGRLFLTSSYGIGAQMWDLQNAKSRLVWSNDEALSSQYNTPIWHAGHLFGIHGREDLGPAELRCVEAGTGRVAWTERDFGVAHLILADEKLLVLKSDGTLILARPSPERFQPLAQVTVSRSTTRALPALSQGRFLFRENRGGGGALVCLALP